ncbi:MAG: hypothetical protein U0V75_02030 [Ferruginibacter sp.]
MQWVKVNTNTPLETFELWQGDKKIASTSFNNSSHIVRMASNAGRRLFFYGNKGWLVQKPVIQNEYGITLGRLEAETDSGEKGFVELDGIKFRYELNTGESVKLELFDDALNKNVASCSFGNVLSKGFFKTKSLMSTRFPQLLLLLCWYSFNMHHHSGTQQPAALPY